MSPINDLAAEFTQVQLDTIQHTSSFKLQHNMYVPDVAILYFYIDK
jgi:hypothetical protein